MVNIKTLPGIEALEGCFFPVKKVPVQDVLPGYETLSGLSHLVIAQPDKKRKIIVNSCSEDYKLVPNREIIEPLADSLHANFKVKVSNVSLGDYARTIVDLVLVPNKLAILEKDDIYGRVRLTNSYDGKIKFSYSYGFYRLICSNGLSIPISESTHFKSLHVVGEKMELDKLTDKVLRDTQGFIKNSKELSSVFHELADFTHTEASAQKRIAEVLEFTDYPKKTAQIAEERLRKEHSMGFPLSDYLIYNALNFGLHNNPESRMQLHKIESIDMEVLNFLTKY